MKTKVILHKKLQSFLITLEEFSNNLRRIIIYEKISLLFIYYCQNNVHIFSNKISYSF